MLGFDGVQFWKVTLDDLVVFNHLQNATNCDAAYFRNIGDNAISSLNGVLLPRQKVPDKGDVALVSRRN